MKNAELTPKCVFDQFAKIEVNGANESPVYEILKKQQPDEEPEGIKNKRAMKAVRKLSKT